MEIVRVLQKHWLLAAIVFCMTWPGLLIFSPIYLPPLLLYTVYVRFSVYNSGQNNQTSGGGNSESADAEKPATAASLKAQPEKARLNKAPAPASANAEEDARVGALLSDKKHELAQQGSQSEQSESKASCQLDSSSQESKPLSEVQSKRPTSPKESAKSAIEGTLRKPALEMLDSQSPEPSVDASSPMKPSDQAAKKSRISSPRKPVEKTSEAFAFGKETESFAKRASDHPKKVAHSVEASNGAGTTKKLLESGKDVGKTSNKVKQAEHVRPQPVAAEKEEPPALPIAPRSAHDVKAALELVPSPIAASPILPPAEEKRPDNQESKVADTTGAFTAKEHPGLAKDMGPESGNKGKGAELVRPQPAFVEKEKSPALPTMTHPVHQPKTELAPASGSVQAPSANVSSTEGKRLDNQEDKSAHSRKAIKGAGTLKEDSGQAKDIGNRSSVGEKQAEPARPQPASGVKEKSLVVSTATPPVHQAKTELAPASDSASAPLVEGKGQSHHGNNEHHSDLKSKSKKKKKSHTSHK